MKIRSAKKKVTQRRQSNRSIFDNSNRVINNLSDVDLVDVELISTPDDNNTSGHIELLVSSLAENLVANGFYFLEIIAELPRRKRLPKKATRFQIQEIFKSRKLKKSRPSRKKIYIDLTKHIDKSLLPMLVKEGNVDLNDSNEDIDLEYVKSTNVELSNPIIEDSVTTGKSEQSDNQGILEIRFGKSGKHLQGDQISEASQKTFDLEKNPIPNNSNDDNFNVSRNHTEPRDVSKISPLLAVLKSKTTNSGNKRRPNLITRSEMILGSFSLRKNLHKPLIKRINRKPRYRIVSEKIKLDLPGPRANLSLRMVNRKTGQVFQKSLKPRRIPVIPLTETYPFKSDLNLPKIQISSLGNSQALVSISNIAPRVNNIRIYRREISSKIFEDNYELINSFKNPPGSFTFIDPVESARAFKYVCLADNLPLYSFAVFRNSNFKYENIQEPFIYAYQSSSYVIIEIKDFPTFYRKLLIYRKSSAENTEVLVEAVSLLGRGRRRFRLIDDPSPVEQSIEYKFVGIDENGIESVIENRPVVKFTAKLGKENANMLTFSAQYNVGSNEVDITGAMIVNNLFIASSDSELSNPTDSTLKAAARGLNIVKIQIRRINLKTEEDEIILKEIINPGISKFDTKLKSQNRLFFSFSDSGENAAIFGYTPTLNMTDYVYIARAIVYPLSIELRKVSDFEKIEGIRAPGKFKYQFDPIIFDHPSNIELGILPSGAGTKELINVDVIGQTSRSFIRNVKVLQSDIADSIKLNTRLRLDSVFDPVVIITGKVPLGLLNDLDHVAIQIEYDTIKRKDIIDRIFLLDETFQYYDYSFDDLTCNRVSYSLIGIGKDFSILFKSEPSIISLKDPKLKLFERRRRALGDLKFIKHRAEREAKQGRPILDFKRKGV